MVQDTIIRTVTHLEQRKGSKMSQEFPLKGKHTQDPRKLGVQIHYQSEQFSKETQHKGDFIQIQIRATML